MRMIFDEPILDRDEKVHPKGEPSFADLAPAGYYIAIRLGFAFPQSESVTFPKPWVDLYAREGLMLDDPAVRWAYANTGVVRWCQIGEPDPRGVLRRAREHGLSYGVVAACGGHGAQRSYGSFARSDRPFTETEIDLLARKLERLHRDMAAPSNLTRAELEVLEMIRGGLRLREIADRIGVTEAAIKQRLKNARGKLDARSASHAVSIATRAGLI